MYVFITITVNIINIIIIFALFLFQQIQYFVNHHPISVPYLSLNRVLIWQISSATFFFWSGLNN